MLRRIFLSITLAGLSSVSALAQSYQTSFAGEKFDQAKGPATYHSGVEVDAATGAASMSFPLGPGVGQRGVHYVPILRGRIAPQVTVGWWPNADGITGHNGPMTKTSPAFDLTPGHLDIYFNATTNSLVTGTNWEFPDGVASSASGTLPSGANSTTMPSLISRFGYASTVSLGNYPYQTTGGTKIPLVQSGSNGEVLLGLIDPTNYPEKVVSSGPLTACYMPVSWSIPGKVLVVRGEVAYEYTFRNPLYVEDAASPCSKVVGGHYALTAIKNGFGGAVTFTYGSNGVDFTAAWTAEGGNPGPSVSVTLASVTTAPSPILPLDPSKTFDGTTPYNYLASLKVTYSGMPNVSTYTLTAASVLSAMPTLPACYTPEICGATNGFEDLLSSFQITQLQVDTTGETISFTYGPGTAVSYTDPGGSPYDSGGTYSYSPIVLASVAFPGRNINLDWSFYVHMPNDRRPYCQGLFMSPLVWAYGVSAIHDQDVSSGLVERLTTHKRVVPIPSNWGGSYPTAFTDTITRPDGTVQLLKFVEPSTLQALNAAIGIGIATDPDILQIQELAFVKCMVREERDYRSATDAANDTPYKVVVSDRWDLRCVTNGNGSAGAGAVPYPTRTKTWDADTQVFTIHESQGWDATQMGWTKTMENVYTTAAPDLSFEWLSLARPPGASPNYATPLFDHSTTRTLGSDPSKWFWGRVTTEQRVGLPPTNRTYDPTTNLISQVTFGDSTLSVTTNNTYTGPLLTGLSLSSTPVLTGSEQVGAMYGYDSLGYMNRIQPNAPSPEPVVISWFLKQTPDQIGRPQDQTDANGKVSTFVWHNGGRLSGITPSEGEQPSFIQFNDTDHLGITVTRGVQKTEYRYDGFNQLVLIRRWDGSNNVSHKVFTYDLMGRKTLESVWLSGPGTDADGRTNTVGDKTVYDARGRVTDHIDPNGIRVHTAYNGLAQTITLGYGTTNPVSTTRTSDALGRLIQVDDALGHSTTYAYDLADRILKSVQYSGAVGVQPSQTRTWTYNNLGWLTSLTQPESGTTGYSNFTVTGKPQTTNYNGRVVNSTFDTLSRVLTVSSTDGVDQEFRYDGSSTYGAALGKLYYSRDLGTERISTYGGTGGRLSALSTNSWTGGALNSGTLMSCNQAFSYDSYGNRNLSTGGQSSVVPSMDDARNMVQGVSVNGTTLVSAFIDPTTWALNSLNYSNGANTTFGYDADQSRLHTMLHASGGQSLAAWTYSYDPSTGRLSTDGEDTYQYDPLGRLTQATVNRLNNQGTVIQSFDYDAFGNQIKSIATGSLPPSGMPGYNINNFSFNSTEQAHMAVNNQLPATSGGAMTGVLYDAQGNLKQFWSIGDTTTQITFIYDALGRVIQMGDSKRGVAETYAYSAEGLRTLIQTFQSGVLQKAVFNVYNDQRQLVSEYEYVQE